MYPGKYAQQHPDRAAFIMADTGDSVTYAELEARSNRLAHLLRAQGLQRLDHYSIFMENNNRYLECCGGGRAGGALLHLHQLVPHRRGAGLHRRQQRVEGADHLRRRSCAVALAALAHCPRVKLLPGRRRRRRRAAHAAIARIVDFADAVGRIPDTPIADECARHADAVLVGHHRPAEGHPAAAAREARRRSRCRCSRS